MSDAGVLSRPGLEAMLCNPYFKELLPVQAQIELHNSPDTGNLLCRTTYI